LYGMYLRFSHKIYHVEPLVSLGSCGGLLESLPVGSIVVPRASVSVTRNYDFDFADPQASDQDAYRVSKLVSVL
jgi:uridine phosphorylase